jgi:uncharacterized protein (DUF2237 family)
MIRRNVFGEPLKLCGRTRSTGYRRDGYCLLDRTDSGTHTVCAVVTQDFLEYTRRQGNDLITPSRYFPGLKPGDYWCLCVGRWIEAYKAGVAPYIILQSTDESVLEYIPKSILKSYQYTA